MTFSSFSDLPSILSCNSLTCCLCTSKWILLSTTPKPLISSQPDANACHSFHTACVAAHLLISAHPKPNHPLGPYSNHFHRDLPQPLLPGQEWVLPILNSWHTGPLLMKFSKTNKQAKYNHRHGNKEETASDQRGGERDNRR